MTPHPQCVTPTHHVSTHVPIRIPSKEWKLVLSRKLPNSLRTPYCTTLRMDTQTKEMCGGRNSQSNGWIHKPRKCVEAETVSQTDGYTNVWRQKQSVKRMDTQTKEMCGGRNSQSNGWIHKPRKCVEAETVSQTDGYTNQGNVWRQKQSVKRMDTQTKEMCGGRNSQSNGWIHKPRKCVEAETVSQTDGYTNQGNVWRQKQSVKRMDTQMCGGRNSQSNGWIHKPRKCVEAETVSQTDGYTNQGNVWRQKQSVKRMDTQTKEMCGGRNSQSNGWIHKPRKYVEAETVSQTDGYTNVWRQKQSVKRMDTQTKEMCGGRNSQSNGWIHKPRKCVEAETVSQTDGYTNQGNVWRQKQSVKRMDTQTKEMCGGRNSQSNGWIHKPRKYVEAETVSQTDGYTNQGPLAARACRG